MGIALIVSFFVLMLIGFPVVIAIALPAIVYVFAFGFPVELISLRIHYALDSYPLLAIPIFIYAGNLMNHTGVTDRIFKFADLSVGRVHGGLAQVNIFAGLMFAGNFLLGVSVNHKCGRKSVMRNSRCNFGAICVACSLVTGSAQAISVSQNDDANALVNSILGR